MEASLIALIIANFAFVGTHFLMSHPLRAPMIGMMGETLFQVVYSIVSLATFAGIYFAFVASPQADLSGTGEVGWAIATVISLPAMVLLAGSFIGNPALPTPMAMDQAKAEPKGVFIITRHPMMWSFTLWAAAHIVLHWSLRTTITATAMAILALVGAQMQDRKKRALMGDAWITWEAKTSFWPRLSGFAKAGALPWTVGLIFLVFFTWLHVPLGGIPAGIWRWFAL